MSDLPGAWSFGQLVRLRPWLIERPDHPGRRRWVGSSAEIRVAQAKAEVTVRQRYPEATR